MVDPPPTPPKRPFIRPPERPFAAVAFALAAWGTVSIAALIAFLLSQGPHWAIACGIPSLVFSAVVSLIALPLAISHVRRHGSSRATLAALILSSINLAFWCFLFVAAMSRSRPTPPGGW